MEIGAIAGFVVSIILEWIVEPLWPAYKNAPKDRKRAVVVVLLVATTAALLWAGCQGLSSSLTCYAQDQWVEIVASVVFSIISSQGTHAIFSKSGAPEKPDKLIAR